MTSSQEIDLLQATLARLQTSERALRSENDQYSSLWSNEKKRSAELQIELQQANAKVSDLEANYAAAFARVAELECQL